MKRFLFSLVLFSVAVASGQSGTPAKLEVSNGKVLKVMLQSLEGGTLTFVPFKSTKVQKGPAAMITGLTFVPKYDEAATEQSFINADYSTVISTLGPVMEPFWQYMPISNNLEQAFGMLVTSHLKTGEFDKVQEAGEILMTSRNKGKVAQGQVFVALAALSTTNGVPVAEKLQKEMSSAAAKLYLQARIERAKGNPREASRIVAEIIASHGNNMQWMPQSELLSAELYLEQGFTNSAAFCARQVQSIYGGSNIAGDAAKLRATLPEPKVKEEPEPVAEQKEEDEEPAEEPADSAVATTEEGQDESTEE